MIARILALAAALSILPVAAVMAQTKAPTPAVTAAAPSTTTIQVGRTYSVVLPNDQPLVLWVESTHSSPDGETITGRVFVQTTSGWTGMSPCDDVVIACQAVPLTVSGVTAGQQLTLGGGS